MTEPSASQVVHCLRLAREGREEALGTLLERYRNYLRLMAATCTARELQAKADTSDVVQETLLNAHRRFHQFRGATEGEWVTWLRRILARNLAQLHRRFSAAGRRVGRERSLEASMDRSSFMLRNLVAAPGPSPSQEAQRREVGVVLADAMAELEPADREVLILRNLRELEWSEIGERIGRSPDAARMLWTRALQRMAPLLKERMS